MQERAAGRTRVLSRRSFLAFVAAACAAAGGSVVLRNDGDSYYVAGGVARPEWFGVAASGPVYGRRTAARHERARFVPAGAHPYLIHPAAGREASDGAV